MITVPTVLVLGAGSSHAYGYSLGEALYNDVISQDHSRVLGAEAADAQIAQFEDFINDLKYCGYYSVDYFLEQFPDYRRIGKAAIARVLSSQEHEHLLFPGPADHWYKHLLNILDDRSTDLGENELTILTYNYDVSLEYYLTMAVANRRRIDLCASSEQLGELNIIHLHGTIGRYPPRFFDDRSYGATNDNMANAVALSDETIRIISEADSQEEVFDRAEADLRRAKRIFFLGFGYADENLKRLRVFDHQWSDEEKQNCLVSGTVQGFTTPQMLRKIRTSLGSCWTTGPYSGSSIFDFLTKECDIEADSDTPPLRA